MTTFNLPLPISTNALFFNKKGKGRIKTPEYRAWIEEAGWEIKRQHVPSFNGPVSLAYELSTKSRMDLPNCEKGVTDLLVAMGIIPDDSPKYVRGVVLSWSSEVEGVRVTVSEVPGPGERRG
jgi:crossover junction endodeoxyribonuclease RusA